MYSTCTLPQMCTGLYMYSTAGVLSTWDSGTSMSPASSVGDTSRIFMKQVEVWNGTASVIPEQMRGFISKVEEAGCLVALDEGVYGREEASLTSRFGA